MFQTLRPTTVNTAWIQLSKNVPCQVWWNIKNNQCTSLHTTKKIEHRTFLKYHSRHGGPFDEGNEKKKYEKEMIPFSRDWAVFGLSDVDFAAVAVDLESAVLNPSPEVNRFYNSKQQSGLQITNSRTHQKMTGINGYTHTVDIGNPSFYFISNLNMLLTFECVI